MSSAPPVARVEMAVTFPEDDGPPVTTFHVRDRDYLDIGHARQLHEQLGRLLAIADQLSPGSGSETPQVTSPEPGDHNGEVDL